jgi:hypothetical protein
VKYQRCRIEIVVFGILARVLFADSLLAQETSAGGFTLKQTVSWINAQLQTKNGFGFPAGIQEISKADIPGTQNYSIDVPPSGQLIIRYEERVLGKNLHIILPNDPPTPWSTTIRNWSSCDENQLVLIAYSETTQGKKILKDHSVVSPYDLDSAVVAIKRNEATTFLVPVPFYDGDELLEKKFLKAFRHLLKQTKIEHPDPF